MCGGSGIMMRAPKYAPTNSAAAMIERVPDVDVAVAVIFEGAQQAHRGDQRRQRRADGLQFPEFHKIEQRRHDDQPASDAEHPGQHPGHQSDSQ